jgi:hypothetical protein
MLLTAALMVSASLIVAAVAQAASGPSSNPFGPGKFPRGKVRTDGTLTVGQQETVLVKGPPGTKFKAAIEPPRAAPVCSQFDFKHFAFCAPQPVFPVAGSPRFRTTRKGRASITFVMPPAYEYLDLDNPLQSRAIPLIDGQSIGFGVSSIRVIHRPNSTVTFEVPLARTTAIVQVLPTPAP